MQDMCVYFHGPLDVVVNSLFITGTDAGFGSRNWQKGTDKIVTEKKRMGIQVVLKVTRIPLR
jgi:hypothetical protein